MRSRALRWREGPSMRDIDDYRDTKIYDGDRLKRGMMIAGPAVLEQQNTTIVVFPGQKLEVNEYGDFVLEL